MPRTSVHLGRAFAAVAAAIFLAGSGLVGVAAQSTGRFRASALGRLPTRYPQPLRKYRLQDLPTQRLSPEQARAWQAFTQAALGGVRAMAGVTPPPAPVQFLDLTTNPRPPLVGDSTKSREIHPFWSWDQNHIYFASNRVDPNGATLPPNNAPYHIWRTRYDGASVEQITGQAGQEALTNQFYPALNHSLTKLAFVGQLNQQQTDRPYQLWVLDLATGQRTQITGRTDIGNSPSEPVKNRDIIAVEKPTWSPNDNIIAFAAREANVPNSSRNIYVVDLRTFVVRRLTNATGALEAIDPVYHPDATNPRITFASNSTGIDTTTGNLQPTAKADHDLFTISELGAAPSRPVTQLTSGPGDDVEPAYNQSDYPPGSNPSQGFFNRWIAFASRGRNGGTTWDIYYLNAPAGPESPSNRAILLFTPDTTGGGVQKNESDERYPTWSAGLPPQQPLDRIAFSSNRQNNPADVFNPTVSATDTDIWVADAYDITPPTLLMFDEQKGETLRIVNEAGSRTGAPGDTFTFYARVKDLQYGVQRAGAPGNEYRRVWVQIKDPDHASQDSSGRNHKLYGESTAAFPSNTNNVPNVFLARWVQGGRAHYLHHAYETDYEAIGVNDYNYYRGPIRSDGVAPTLARFASYNPGVDDSVRWSGRSFPPPQDSSGQPIWLELRDDGVAPDQVKGDDIYTAQWRTPNEPSDFYVDLIAYDEAPNPRNPTNQVGNWIIYDNIWGFTTQSFLSRNPVLFVDDNGAGQKWPRGLQGRFRRFPTYRHGTESDCLDREDRFKPKEVRGSIDSNGNETPPFNLVTPLFGTQDFLHGSQSPDFIPFIGGRAYKYDLWRILARGPVPEAVLNDYLPRKQTQPRNITGTQTVDQPVPKRAVVWNAPYTGDIFLGAGSILDQATQTELTKYRDRGGRLVIAGGDILWALTVDNAIPDQQFVQNVLGAIYTGDTLSFDNARPRVDNPISIAVTRDGANALYQDLGGTPPHYNPLWDPDWLGFAPNHPGFQDAPGLNDNAPFPPDSDWQGNHEHFTTATDGTPFQQQDGVAPRSGWVPVFQDRMIARDDSAGSTKSKTVFMSFSLASMGRRYTAEDDRQPLVCLNYRAKIGHALFCWMFSADLVGQVVSIEGGVTRPVPGAYVQAYQGGQLVGAAFADANGFYSIQGLPIGSWNVRVDSPGFQSYQKDTGAAAHGLDQATLDVLLTPAAPGSISGKVTDTFGNPVPGVGILATLQAPPLYTGAREFRATTGPDGTYRIPSAPVGDYVVTVETLPPLFGNPQPAQRNVRVNPSTDTPNVDFTVEGQPSDLTVQVFAQNPDFTRGNPIPGATVKVFDSANNEVASGVTISDPDPAKDGTVVLTVPAGRLRVEASASGYQTTSKSVDTPQTRYVEILLPAGPVRQPGRISGRVVELAAGGGSGPGIPNATVEVLRGNQLVATLTTDASGNYATAGPLPGGDYTLRGSASGFLPATLSVTVDGDVVAPDLRLARPATIRGAVRSSVDGSFIGGATVTLRDANGNVVQTTTTSSTGSGTPAGNFQFGNLQPGRYTVLADKAGWRPAQATLDVALNETRFVTLRLDPEHLFGRGLLLVSIPYDNSTDAAALFGQSPSTFKSAYWVNPPGRYAIYPEEPARRFALGKGMFVRFPSPTAFSAGGTPAPDAPFEIPVRAGWNMIGSVRRARPGFDGRIEWLRVRVRTQTGALLTMQEAMDQGVIMNGLFGYIDGYFRSDYLVPFSGYFMKAHQDATLIVPVDNSIALAPGAREKVARMPAPSLAQVAKELVAAGLAPAETLGRFRPAPAEARGTGESGQSGDGDRMERRSPAPAVAPAHRAPQPAPRRPGIQAFFRWWPWRPNLG